MSERSNPRLDNFEDAKAKTEQEKFENELYGDAGTTDFSEEARRRVEEADEYERHMEEMAKRDTFDPEDDAAAAARRREYGFPDLNDEPSPAYERELETMVAETKEADERARAEKEAFAAKLASSPVLRLANKISKEYEAARNKLVDEDTTTADEERVEHLGDRLQELLLRYSESDDYDPAVAAFLIDRDDETAFKSAAERAHRDATGEGDDLDDEPKKGEDKEGDDLDDEPKKGKEDKDGDDLDDEPKTGADDDLDDEPKKGKDEGDDDLDDEPKPGMDDDLDEEPKKGLDDDEEDPDKKKGDDEEEDDDTPLTDEELAEIEAEVIAEFEAKEAARRAERREAIKNFIPMASTRLHMLFTGGRDALFDKYRGSSKKKKIALGALAVIGVGIAAWWGIDQLQDRANDAANNGASGGGPKAPNPVDTGTPGVDQPPVGPADTTPELPTYSPDALNVDTGEGWFKTMREIGITDPSARQAIIENKDVMNQLVDMGLAYEAPDLGGYGINMPDNGQMPRAALDILEAANRNL